LVPESEGTKGQNQTWRKRQQNGIEPEKMPQTQELQAPRQNGGRDFPDITEPALSQKDQVLGTPKMSGKSQGNAISVSKKTAGMAGSLGLTRLYRLSHWCYQILAAEGKKMYSTQFEK